MRVVVRGREEAEKILSSSEPSVDALVSIHSPPNSLCAHYAPWLGKPCAGFNGFPGPRLSLAFDDTREHDSKARKGSTPPAPSHVERLLAWSKLVPDDASVLIHCAMGESRSTAAAFIFLTHRLGKGSEEEAQARVLAGTNKIARPNLFLICIADKVMKRKGAMLSLWSDWSERQRSVSIYG